jgi:hypothetical protein
LVVSHTIRELGLVGSVERVNGPAASRTVMAVKITVGCL